MVKSRKKPTPPFTAEGAPIAGEGQEDEALREDLIVFRWLEQQISNKNAIRACLLVLQGIAYNAGPLDAGQGGAT